MLMSSNFLSIVPVIPSRNIETDVQWYRDKTGFECAFADNMYAVLYRDNLCLHLQWHADTPGDPLLGGSVMRIFVTDIDVLANELIERGTISREKLVRNTPWGTHEFGFYDLNQNGIFIVQDIL